MQLVGRGLRDVLPVIEAVWEPYYYGGGSRGPSTDAGRHSGLRRPLEVPVSSLCLRRRTSACVRRSTHARRQLEVRLRIAAAVREIWRYRRKVRGDSPLDMLFLSASARECKITSKHR